MPDNALERYQSKRNFDATPEPRAGGLPSPGALRFVVHKHWASRLHYDLRLELDGSMKSWAVPKGPSYDSADKRMAVQVEDHPIAYNTFEGTIPPGQYGAGKVIVWDKGCWEPIGDAGEGYRQGRLKFVLHGHKLQGRWTLVRMRGRGSSDRAPAWLWIKERDGLERAAADYSVVDARPESVAAQESAPGTPPAPADVDTPQTSVSALMPGSTSQVPHTALPALLAPQLATLVEEPPPHPEEWLFELKFDGYRLLARIEDGQARLFTRSGKDWSARLPGLAQALAALALRSGWIDGEVLVLNDQGLPDFQALQNAFDARRGHRPVYYAFDLLFADGQDLRALPLRQRRERLRQLLAGADSSAGTGTGAVRFSAAFEAPPLQLVASACQLGFEGVIGKRLAAPYASGERNADWIKLKCSQRQEFVLGGYTDPQGARTALGSLLLGVHAPDGTLRYAGNVGTGFNEQSLRDLHQRLAALEVRESPFAQPRALPARGVHWVQPTLVAEVSFAGWTQAGRVRHAVFHGLREDKPAQAVVRERAQPLAAPAAGAPAAAAPSAAAAAPTAVSTGPSGAPPRSRSGQAKGQVQVEGLTITHPERVIDTASGTTKFELARYCAAVAPLMMEHLLARPVALVRAPEGVQGAQFFQKHLDIRHLPGVATIAPGTHPEHPALLEVVRAEGLVAAAQRNVIEFHTWNARKDRMDRPDRMTLDLDPGAGVPWGEVCEAAQLVQVLLVQLGLPAFLKTSGGKGLHVVVPLQRRHGWDAVKGFAQALVRHLARTIPQRFVAKSGPHNRVGKIFVDYLRNGWGATTACAWSPRARPGMGISVPVAWDELAALAGSAQWTVRSAGERLAVGNAPWAGYADAAAALGAAMRTLGCAPVQEG